MEPKLNSAFDYDTEKAALIKKSNSIENNLDFELDQVKEYLQEYGKNIAIIGGSLLATYLLAKLIAGSNSKESSIKLLKDKVSSTKSPVVHIVKQTAENALTKQIKSSIGLFLMSIAKQKLMDYLNKNLVKSE
ncbi:MAG: hypothetical protein H7329_15600 [Opitutaceae bacterium]|nr:hypothetical protein [Cytophagales bacterium]